MDIESRLISVVIPFFNEENFLSEAIESVLQQDYAEWELILVNDGSTDESSSIALKYAKLHPTKIYCYTHELGSNKGLSASRNLGISKAKGALIALLDADDIWLPKKLSYQIRVFEKHPEIGLLCEASEYYNWNNPKKKLNPVLTVGNDLLGIYYPPQLLSLLYPLGKGAAPVPSGIMFKKQAWENVSGFEEIFTGNNQMYEDQAFLCKMYLKEIIYISKKQHNRYRQREGSLVQDVKAKGKYSAVRKFFLNWLSAYLNKENLRTPMVSALLHEALSEYNRGVYRYAHSVYTNLKKWIKPNNS